MKKRCDPLWAIVGEEVGLQGSEQIRSVVCPACKVLMEVPDIVPADSRFRCGLCGAPVEVGGAGLVADDGLPEVGAGLAK